MGERGEDLNVITTLTVYATKQRLKLKHYPT
jgi:hypothetical protein